MPTKSYIIPNETFYIDHRGFIYLKFYRANKYNLITIDQLNEQIEVFSNIFDKNTSSILVDIRDIFGLFSVDFRCFRLLAKDIRLKKVCNKIAFITNSDPLNIKINNYINKFRPTIKTRVFRYIDDAIDFCKKE